MPPRRETGLFSMPMPLHHVATTFMPRMTHRMVEPLLPDAALALLDARLLPDGRMSDKIAAFRTPEGKHLALERTVAGHTQLWLERAPIGIDGVSVLRTYAADAPRNSNLNASRGARLSVGRAAVTVAVATATALEHLLHWYTNESSSMENTTDALCLLGTWEKFDEAALKKVQDSIDSKGGWASTWSFVVKPESRDRLQTPFWLYLNRKGNHLNGRLLVEEFVSSPDVSQTPWPEITDEDRIGVTSEGDKPADRFRTWFRVTRAEMLVPALSKEDFTAAEGLSTPASLLHQHTFGYAYRKPAADTQITPMPITDAVPDIPLNTILYGPPGTSKTFEVVERALAIIDPVFLDQHRENRQALRTRFDELRGNGRIEFVTFHQSFSYEDFVEGIRASTEEGGITYRVESGVFKRLCDRASSSQADDRFRIALDAFKQQVAEEAARLQTKQGKWFTVTWNGGKTLRFKPDAGQNDVLYPVSLEQIERLYRGEDESGFYNISYVRGVLAHIVKTYGVPPYAPSTQRQPYVLIIDEINRGNMASIFGELITLIEPSKRAGASEALSTTLPYSGRDGGSFSVPDNLYLIGTMNTADRSLARVDTALRRRFSFIPLYPDPTRVRHVEVEGIVLERLLTTINDRIEYLYDRDHLIGHAFFMDLVEDPARRTLARLAEIFEQKVIPLLEEYFFKDWRKIRWILGDDRKPERQHQFILEEPFPDLTPLDDRDTAGKPPMRYRRNDAALRHVESYRQIYAPLT